MSATVPREASAERREPVTGNAPARSGLAARTAVRLGGGVAQIFVVVAALIWLIPTVGLAVASLRTSAANTSTGWWHVFAHPGELTLANYGRLFADSSMMAALRNTLFITVPSTVLVVVLGALAAYALAWREFKGRDTLFVVIVALIAVPIQIAIIPDAKVFGAIGIFGTLIGVITFHVAFGLPFAIFLMRNFFVAIPRDLIEAARIDGASELKIFATVVVPIGWPAIASLAIYQFMWVWNDLLVARIFAGASSKPITYAVQERMGAFSSNIDIIAPSTLLSMALPLLVFFFFQRYYVQGVLAGSAR